MKWNEHTRDWVNALRGDRYRQGMTAMRILPADTTWDEAEADPFKFEYCCLGVASHLAGCTFTGRDDSFRLSAGGIQRVAILQDPEDNRTKSYNRLPTWLCEFLDLSSEEQDTLAAMNDGTATFEEIAWAIESAARTGRDLGDFSRMLHNAKADRPIASFFEDR